MANSFHLRGGSDVYVRRSNTATDKLLGTLVLAGSALASHDDEKRLVLFIAEHDQAVRGLGTVGFDLDELPWDRHRFAEQKVFLLRVIDAALDQRGWEAFGGAITVERAVESLVEFRQLVEQFDESMLDEQRAQREAPVIPSGYPRCARHGVLLAQRFEAPELDPPLPADMLSCCLCNDGQVDCRTPPVDYPEDRPR